MGLSSKLHTFLSFQAFVDFQPVAAECLSKIAVETIGEVEKFVNALRGLEALQVLIVVLPALREVRGRLNFTDVADNEEGWDQRCWEMGLKIGRTATTEVLKEMVEKAVVGEMKRLKAEKRQNWMLPNVRVVERWDCILDS